MMQITRSTCGAQVIHSSTGVVVSRQKPSIKVEHIWNRTHRILQRRPSLRTVGSSRAEMLFASTWRRERTHLPRTVKASATAAAEDGESRKSSTALIINISIVLLLAVANRVLNKMATVPMSEYLFFLALFQTFGYIIFYGTILQSRKRSGQVTRTMLSAPDNRKFLLVGLLESTAQVISMTCVSKLPGVVLPLLNQTILLWQVILGYALQGQRYSSLQLSGIALVIGGVVKAAWPQGGGASVLGQTEPIYAAMYAAAFLLLAGAAVTKDSIFADASKKLKGEKLDLFIVNTRGSLAQAGFVTIFLPVLCSLKGISLGQLPAFCSGGLKTLLGMTSASTGSKIVPLLYILVNLTMNIAVLNLLRNAGAVVTTLTMSSTIPLTIFAFTFSWPLIGAAAALNLNFIIGTVILLLGLLAFNWSKLLGKQAKA